MSQKVNWEYYSSLFSKVTEEEFDALERRAENEVMLVVGPIRWNEITETTFGYETLKICICGVVNKLKENDTSSKGKGLASASNDGYSESYVIQTEAELDAEMKSAIKKWLSGTGLVGAY